MPMDHQEMRERSNIIEEMAQAYLALAPVVASACVATDNEARAYQLTVAIRIIESVGTINVPMLRGGDGVVVGTTYSEGGPLPDQPCPDHMEQRNRENEFIRRGTVRVDECAS